MKLYTVKWSDSTAGIKECRGSTVIECRVIEINRNALGADKIVVTDFDRVEFSLPKKFENLTPGKSLRHLSVEKEVEEQQKIRFSIN